MNNATTSSSCYFLPLLTPVVSVGVTFQELNVLNFCSFSRYKQVKWLVRTVTKLLISISPTSTTEHGWWHPKTCSLTSMNIYYGSRRYTTSRESVGKKKFILATGCSHLLNAVQSVSWHLKAYYLLDRYIIEKSLHHVASLYLFLNRLK